MSHAQKSHELEAEVKHIFISGAYLLTGRCSRARLSESLALIIPFFCFMSPHSNCTVQVYVADAVSLAAYARAVQSFASLELRNQTAIVRALIRFSAPHSVP